jgi:hypothetical protein
MACKKSRSGPAATLSLPTSLAHQGWPMATFWRQPRRVKWTPRRVLTHGRQRQRRECRSRPTWGYLRYVGQVHWGGRPQTTTGGASPILRLSCSPSHGPPPRTGLASALGGGTFAERRQEAAGLCRGGPHVMGRGGVARLRGVVGRPRAAQGAAWGVSSRPESRRQTAATPASPCQPSKTLWAPAVDPEGWEATL